MEYKLSKMARIAIILNIVLTLIIGSIHIATYKKIIETDKLIYQVMTEKNVIRETAIRTLQADGVELYLKEAFSTVLGMYISIINLVLLIIYSRNNGFVLGFITAFSCVFTSYIGGFILFYVMLSGKGQRGGNGGKFAPKDEWDVYMHNKNTIPHIQ